MTMNFGMNTCEIPYEKSSRKFINTNVSGVNASTANTVPVSMPLVVDEAAVDLCRLCRTKLEELRPWISGYDDLCRA